MKSSISMILVTVALIANQSCKTEEKMEAPVAEKKAKELTIHGDTRVDNYYWLRERENPEVIAYLEAENAYREEVMKGTENLQESLFNEIIGRIKQTDESVPYKENGYYYYVRYIEGKEYPIYCRKKGSLDGEEEVIADVNEMAEGYAYYDLSGVSISPDNRYAVMGIDTVSRRNYTLMIKDLETGNMLDDVVPLTTGGASWAADNSTIFYTRKDDVTLRSKAIYRHTMGADASNDILVYEEEDETFNTYVYKSKSREYMIIGSASTLTSEYRVLEADNPSGEFRVVQPRVRGLEYDIAHFGDYFYIITNLNAVNFRLMKTSVNRGGKENWKEVIAHREEAALSIFMSILTAYASAPPNLTGRTY